MNMRTNLNIWLVVCVFLVVVTSAAEGRTLTVNDDGGAQYTKIQDAIDKAFPSDEIRVSPGTYNESIDFLNRYSLRLYSSHGPEVTIIDGGGADAVILCKGPAHVNRLEGFKITGGHFGMRIESSDGTTVTNCMFRDNYRGIDSSQSYYSVTNCTFTHSTFGGGIHNYGGNPVVKNCTFSDNMGIDGYGGGISNLLSSPTIIGCIFRNNEGYFGGGIYNDQSSSTVTNCVFIGNEGVNVPAGYFGSAGAITNWSYNSLTVTNCTFSGNSGKVAGAILNGGGCELVVANCISWGNILVDGTRKEIYNFSGGSCAVTYSNIRGGWVGTGNINADPLFVNAAGGDLRLRGCSPAQKCVDAGNNSAVPSGITTDCAGKPRFIDIAGVNDTGAGTPPIVDMGAYEQQATSGAIINVPAEFNTIQAAINAACPGDEIIVAAGTYKEAINFLGKAIALRSTNPNDPNVIAATVINGNGAYHVVQCVSSEGPDTILEGFTITGGNANGPEWPDGKNGGGMYCRFSSPTVVGCTFSGNTAEYGGGLASRNGGPTVTNCTFKSNSGEFGGGLYNFGCNPITVTNCTFISNSSEYGGGVQNDSSIAVLTNCLFIANTSTFVGGGMHNLGGIPTVTNCTFSANAATHFGGGIHNYHSSPTVTNCNFNGNTASDNGGGMYNDGSGPAVTDCNFSGNTAYDRGGGMFNNACNPTVTDCAFSNNTANRNGGGMYNILDSNPTVIRCTFAGNKALSPDYGGGGMFNNNACNPPVTDCTFSNNTANRNGGGMYNYESSPTVTNCTFSGNVAVGGAGIRNWNSNPTVKNCILWDNNPDEISSDGTSAPTVQYCDVQGGHGGTGNINTDPLFLDAVGGDLRLSSGSPCIDTGSSTAVPSGITTDLDGNPRIVHRIVDMGAYERQCEGFQGSGTQADPFLVRDANELNHAALHTDAHFRLTDDIDLEDPVSVIGSEANPFTGVFDGDGHTISFVKLTSTGGDCMGLFGFVDGDEARIKDLGLADVGIYAGTAQCCGALVGHLKKGIISSCYVGAPRRYRVSVMGEVQGGSHVGGLVGWNEEGIISDCYAAVDVLGDANNVGGLVGYNCGTIINCYSIGAVIGTAYVGGIVGYDEGGTYRGDFWLDSDSILGGIGNSSDPNVIGLDDPEMKKTEEFLAAGWDFVGEAENGPSDIWAYKDRQYPRLVWQDQGTGDEWPLYEFAGGTGTSDEPYLVATADDLNHIGHNPRLMDVYFKLIEDVNLADVDFFVIGSLVYPFEGCFDGNGKIIRSFSHSCDPQEPDYVGLFGYVDGPGALIKDVGIEDCNITGGMGDLIGSLVGCLHEGTILRSYADGGYVSSEGRYIGGLAGKNDEGLIVDCYSTVAVSGANDVGGLVGGNEGGAIGCCYSGAVVTGSANIGGLVGYSDSGYYESCFWDTNSTPIGMGYGTDPNVMGKSRADMQTKSTFTDAGWDFVGESTNGTSDTWAMCVGADYARLAWQYVIGDFDGDGDTDFGDFCILGERWLGADISFWCGGCDLTDDGEVNVGDLKSFAEGWLAGVK